MVITHFAKLTEQNSKLLIYNVKNKQIGKNKKKETGLCVQKRELIKKA